MPAIYISTNVKVDGLDLDPLFKAATLSLSSILARSPDLVMLAVNGSVKISFGGSQDPAAFAELFSMGGIDKSVKRKLISTMASLLLLFPVTPNSCAI